MQHPLLSHRGHGGHGAEEWKLTSSPVLQPRGMCNEYKYKRALYPEKGV